MSARKQKKSGPLDVDTSMLSHSIEVAETIGAKTVGSSVETAKRLLACAIAAPDLATYGARVLALLDEWRDQSEGRYPSKDPACPECTEGSTPANYPGRGLCAEHGLRAALKAAGVSL